jgi:general secretion pathway protein D
MKTKGLKSILFGLFFIFSLTNSLKAESCVNKLFSVTIDNTMTIGDALDNLAETCGLTVVVKDSGAKHKLGKKLYYVKLKNATLKSFLDTLLRDNDLNYTLRGNKLTISYLMTRTFKIHYVAGDRQGQSKANVTIAGDSGVSNNKAGQKGSSITITTNQKFQFWNKIKEEVHKILNTAGDGSIHFTKVGNEWIGPDGQKWEYNPLEPVVNPEAGLVTVTGTPRQIQRVSKYIATLTKQIKTEVMIDVQILDVRMSSGKTTGIDWNKIYGMGLGISGSYNGGGIADPKGGAFTATISGDLSGFLKFLRSQGDLISVSSPKVMTLNNQPAMISVGKEIFYTTTSVTSANSGGGQNFQSQEINSVFAGILLDITPEVDERGMVTLKINPSISKEAVETPNDNGNTVRTMPPDLIRRQIASVIKVRDGDHAILGGLITRSKEKINSKVPLISDIPILGKAFKRSEYTDVIDELVIIITPHIIRNGSRGVSLRDLGYRKIR